MENCPFFKKNYTLHSNCFPTSDFLVHDFFRTKVVCCSSQCQPLCISFESDRDRKYFLCLRKYVSSLPCLFTEMSFLMFLSLSNVFVYVFARKTMLRKRPVLKELLLKCLYNFCLIHYDVCLKIQACPNKRIIHLTFVDTFNIN